jgi:hypothetical protein
MESQLLIDGDFRLGRFQSLETAITSELIRLGPTTSPDCLPRKLTPIESIFRIYVNESRAIRGAADAPWTEWWDGGRG